MTYLSLVDKAQHILAELIRPGDTVIDATVGNGNDTVFLAKAVTQTGHVLGFDIQQQSLQNARNMLQQHNLQHRVTLFLQSHADLNDCIPKPMQHRIKAVMFNLGYLPGSDKAVVTRAESTVSALRAALPHLLPGGVISILAYRGHPGGEQETRAVLEWSSHLDNDKYAVDTIEPPALSEKTPLLVIIKRGLT
jgi:predicted methyltransferase